MVFVPLIQIRGRSDVQLTGSESENVKPSGHVIQALRLPPRLGSGSLRGVSTQIRPAGGDLESLDLGLSTRLSTRPSLSPSSHRFADEFIPSGLSAEGAIASVQGAGHGRGRGG
jgi:hypothetical protein